ncbi:MAG: hypothetical protein AAB531_04320 [Patescibacteria group bacterium]
MNERFGPNLDQVERLLGESRIKAAISEDMQRVDVVDHKEQWKLAVIKPDEDRVIFQAGEFDDGMGILEKTNRFGQMPLKHTVLLYPGTIIGKQEGLSIKGGGVKRLYPTWMYLLDSKPKKGESMRIEDYTIGAVAFFRRGIPELQSSLSHMPQSMPIPEFLQKLGFPLKESYADGDPLNLERGGIITPDGAVHHPEFFVQRSVVDDEGNLIVLGHDEGAAMEDTLKMQPAFYKKLAKQGFRTNGPFPFLVRYRSHPVCDETMLPILDVPMSANGWSELVINPQGKARLFIARDCSDNQWAEMMSRLQQLLIDELGRKGNHLLAFTKDKDHLNDYLKRKEVILRDYFVVEDLGKFTN